MGNLKRILLLSVLAIFVGFALFPKEIFLTCIKYQAARYCKKTFGASFTYDTLAWKEGRILFTNGSVCRRGTLEAHFSEAIFKPSLDIKRRELGGKVEIKGLRAINRKTYEQALPTSSLPLLPFLKLNLQTCIRGGEAYLYDYLGTSPLFQKLEFDFDHHIHDQMISGQITIDWEGNAHKLTTHFWQDRKATLRLKTDFQAHAFPPLYHLMAYFFHPIMPQAMSCWSIGEGTINGKLDMTLIRGQPFRLKGGVTIEELYAVNDTLELIGEVERFKAKLDVDFSSVTMLNGEFLLQGGKLALDQQAHCWEGEWDLRNLNTQIHVKEGKVDSSVVRGSFLGMDGEVVLDWHSPHTLMTMGFKGHSGDMATLFPAAYQKIFSEAFEDDLFTLKATLSRTEGGLEMEGKLLVDETERHTLDFGCLFVQGEGLGEKALHIAETLPFSLSRSVDAFLDHLAHQFCLSQKRFGWFSGENLPLEKFVSPFLFSSVRMDLSGRANFQGTFDERFLVVSYEGKDFHLESPHFYLHADVVEEEKVTDVVAVHYLDFEAHSHVGFLPIRHAEYYQKNRDLSFTEGRAMIHIDDRLMHIQDVEAKWSQIELKGNLELDIKARDDVDLVIKADSIFGPAADAQEMLSHFSDSIFWEIPFTGNVQSVEEAFTFHYHFSPKAELVSGHLHGDFEGVVEKPYLECAGHVDWNISEITLDVTAGPHAFNAAITKEAITVDGEEISLLAARSPDSIHVESFSFGNWEGDGELVWEGRELFFRNIELRETAKEIELALSGTYDRASKVMRGDLEGFQWEFGKNPSIWEPRGAVLGSGIFEWSLEKGADVRFTTSFRGLEFGGIHFGDGENLSCTYSSKYGATVEGLEVEIPTEQGVERYKLGRFCYDLMHQKLLFEGFDFSLPPEKLPWVAEMAANLFPGKIHPNFGEWVEALKQNEPLEGKISLEVYPDNVWVYLSLKDGAYYFADNQFNFKNFLLLYDPNAFNIWTKVQVKEEDYWIHLLTDSQSLSRGKLEVSEYELSPTIRSHPETLLLDWELTQERGWLVNQIQGSFHGLKAALEREEGDRIDLIPMQGQITLDPKRFTPLLSAELRSIVERYSLGGKYTLDGRFVVPKHDLSRFAFSGSASGAGVRVAGVELDSFASQLTYQPGRVDLSHLGVYDWAGSLSIDQAALVQQAGRWALSCENLKVEDVRLSRIKSPWTRWTARDKRFYRSFYIRNLDLSHFEANLDDPRSFRGQGRLQFTNLPKKTLFNNLLFIPTEITARIGLDFSSFIPVRGTIDYRIADGRVYFNEFKDMFSDGKHSRFYLAKGSEAYVDFDGNLNLKLKMKQYNLLMKLAELLTISVKGTVLKPTYTFSNQVVN